jgi:FixJ family two-component response regulator
MQTKMRSGMPTRHWPLVQCRHFSRVVRYADLGASVATRPSTSLKSGASKGTETVYLVDDEAPVRSALSRLLRSAGFRVWSFGTAEEFLCAAQPRQTVSCLVVDLCMPGLSGLDLQELLLDNGLDVPVVFISGRADVPASVRAMKGGAIDFLEKPFSEETLFGAVRSALDRDRERRASEAERADLSARLATLSPREREVFDLVVAGRLNKQAAAELGILEGTIKVHRARVMQKMAAGSLAELVRMSERLTRREGPAERGVARH